MNTFQSKKQKVKRIQIQKLKTKKRKTKRMQIYFSIGLRFNVISQHSIPEILLLYGI